MRLRLLAMRAAPLALVALGRCHPSEPGPPGSPGQGPSSTPVVGTYHVAAGPCSHGSAPCSDANSGRSRSEPLCTVQAGLDKLAAGSGEILVIHSGTYVDDAELPGWAGTGGKSAAQPITVEGAPGDPPSSVILRGTASQSGDREDPTTRDTAVLRIAGLGGSQRIQNIRVKDLTISPGNVHGIFVFNGSYVEVDNVDFAGWQGQPTGGSKAAAFAVKGSDHVTLKNSRMENGGVQQAGASGIEVTGAVSDVLIYNNVVHDFEGGCTHGSSSGSGKGRVLFAQNDFRNCKGNTDETATFQIYNDEDFMFYGNLVEVPPNGLDEVFSIRRTTPASKTSSAHIIGNTIVNQATGTIFAVRVWGRTPDAAVIRNNIFIGFDRNPHDAVIRVEHIEPCDGYDEDYNYVFGLPPAPLQNSSGCQNVAWGPHTVLTATVPPGLDASYAPLPGAPVVDAGDPSLAWPEGSTPPKDIGVFDLGAPRLFPLSFTPLLSTSRTPLRLRWGGVAEPGDIVLTARNRPRTAQTAFRVQVDTVPSFDSVGIATPLLDSGLVSSSDLFWTAKSALPPGNYYGRVTVSDVPYEQEWSDPYFRFTVAR
jgi:parallel beta helix pectate lyase-like protein